VQTARDFLKERWNGLLNQVTAVPNAVLTLPAARQQEGVTFNHHRATANVVFLRSAKWSMYIMA
jgi:hypothetical protein